MNDSGRWVWCPYIASFEKLWVWWKVKSNWSLEFCDPDPDAPMSLLSHFSIHLLCSLRSLRSLLILVVSHPHPHHSAESPWSPVTSYLVNPRADISPHLFVARLPSCPLNLLHPLWLLLASLSASLPQPHPWMLPFGKYFLIHIGGIPGSFMPGTHSEVTGHLLWTEVDRLVRLH